MDGKGEEADFGRRLRIGTGGDRFSRQLGARQFDLVTAAILPHFGGAAFFRLQGVYTYAHDVSGVVAG